MLQLVKNLEEKNTFYKEMFLSISRPETDLLAELSLTEILPGVMAIRVA